MQSPGITRFRDIAAGRCGVSAAEMADAFYQEECRRLFSAREQARRGVRTVDAWRRERRNVRARFLKAIGGELPRGQTRVRHCGEIVKPDLVIRKILFSPFGEHWVSANLYLPRRRAGRVPVLLTPHGHGLPGKAGYGERTLFFCLNGYAVLTFDYLGGGERCLTGPDGKPFAPASAQHNLMGCKMALDGYNLQWFMIAETMGAVDVVTQCEEIDGTRIGMTGASGGGTETFFAGALDDRVKVMVPAASVHSFANRLHPGDTEQTAFGAAGEGTHYPDAACFLTAPRPLFVVANTQDIWDLPGTRHVVEEAKRFYELLEAGDRIGMRVWRKGHAYDYEQWRVALRWFNRWLDGAERIVPPDRMDRRNIPSEAETHVTERGNLFLAGFDTPGTTLRRVARLAVPSARRSAALTRLKARVRRGVPRKVTSEEIDRWRVGNLSGSRIIFAPEPGLFLPCDVLRPAESQGVTILVDELPRSAGQEWQMTVAHGGHTVLRPDLRGWGETQPADSWSDWEGWTNNVYTGKRALLASAMHLVGRDAPVERARDVLALLRVVRQMGVAGPTTVWARRGAVLPALLAGLADGGVDRLILENFLFSFADLRRHDMPFYSPDGLVYGLLRDGLDIPDLCRAFRPRDIVVRSSHDGLCRPVAPAKVRNHAATE